MENILEWCLGRWWCREEIQQIGHVFGNQKVCKKLQFSFRFITDDTNTLDTFSVCPVVNLWAGKRLSAPLHPLILSFGDLWC